jgi:hypothetical protein
VPVPPLDAASTRTSISNPSASSRPVQAALKVGLEVMPIDGVTLSDGHCPGERTPTRRSVRAERLPGGVTLGPISAIRSRP